MKETTPAANILEALIDSGHPALPAASLIAALPEAAQILFSGGPMFEKLLQVADLVAQLPEIEQPIADALVALVKRDHDAGSVAALKGVLARVAAGL